MPVITIAREYGAGGTSVANLLAAELGTPVIDRSLIAEVARRVALPVEDVAQEDEHGRTLLDRFARAFVPVAEAAGGAVLAPEDLVDPHDQIEAVTRVVLGEAGRSGDAIVVGRGGAVELRDLPGALHVFLWAPLPDRVRVIRERDACDEPTARHRIREVDAARAAFIHEVYGADWRDRSLYDLVLNTGRLGYAGAARAILAALAVRQAPPQPSEAPPSAPQRSTAP